ncbi:hypothetical protein [Streptomyces sp. NPDC048191]|uniref:hypothetical protein n=1 Tax=Streptomyces sp. NPDC048191 TaxID=3155484 RepID=UPI0033D4611B
MRWGARLASAGLATTVALAVATGTAAAQQGNPRQVPNGSTCQSLLGKGSQQVDVEGPNSVTMFKGPGGPGQIQATEELDPAGQVFNFSITGPYAARAVIVHSALAGIANAWVYDSSTGFPAGLAADQGLHATIDPATAEYHSIDGIAFCVIASPYNGTV